MQYRCKKCGQECELAEYAVRNVENYGGDAIVTLDCGHAVTIERVCTLVVDTYNGYDAEDSWGTPICS